MSDHGHRTNPFDENGAYVDPKESHWSFEFEDDQEHHLTIESAVFTALGAASMCWSGGPQGVFGDVHVTEIGNKLIKYIKEQIESAIANDREGR